MKLRIDSREIPLNDFVERILTGMVIGGVNALKGIKDDWEKIEIEVSK
jgi:hypothetical protein